MSRPTENSPAFPRRRLALVLLAFAALAGAWVCMTAVSRRDPWYRHTDMNIHNLVDALAINSDVAPARVDQPALPPKYLLALDFRVRHFLGGLPVWNFRKLNMSPDPLREIVNLIHLERVHSRCLVILLILAGAGLTYVVSRSLESACLAVILLSGSSGLLFHGLITRPDLLCTAFGTVLALLCSWKATSVRSGLAAYVWLFLAGLMGGLAVLSKLPGMYYLATCFLWCWLAVLTPEKSRGSSNRTRIDFWVGLLPVISGLAALWLVRRLVLLPDALSPEAVLRLRVVAIIAIALPLAGLGSVRHRLGAFLLERVRELAALAGGALAALTLCYGLLCAVMTTPQALCYIAGVTQIVFDPSLLMKGYLSARPDLTRQFLFFVRDTPFLFATTVAAVVAVVLVRSISGRLRAFIVLLLLNGLGMALLLSRREFADQFGVFVQVPLLLAWPLGLFGLGIWRANESGASPRTGHWAVPIALTASVVILLSVYFRVQPRYEAYQADAALPVNDLTLTFLFDHDAHPKPYREIMAGHYGDRQEFARALEHYLADPANRY